LDRIIAIVVELRIREGNGRETVRFPRGRSWDMNKDGAIGVEETDGDVDFEISTESA